MIATLILFVLTSDLFAREIFYCYSEHGEKCVCERQGPDILIDCPHSGRRYMTYRGRR